MNVWIRLSLLNVSLFPLHPAIASVLFMFIFKAELVVKCASCEEATARTVTCIPSMQHPPAHTTQTTPKAWLISATIPTTRRHYGSSGHQSATMNRTLKRPHACNFALFIWFCRLVGTRLGEWYIVYKFTTCGFPMSIQFKVVFKVCLYFCTPFDFHYASFFFLKKASFST